MSEEITLNQLHVEVTFLAAFCKYCDINLENIQEEIPLTEDECKELFKISEIAEETVIIHSEEQFSQVLTEYIRSIIQRSKE